MHKIKTNFFLLLFVGLPVLARSQQDEIATLIQAAYEEKATGTSPNRILARWLRVYDAVQEIEGHKEFSNACISIANIYEQEQLYKQALPYYLKAAEALGEQTNIDSQTQNLYLQLAQTYAHLIKPDSAYYYYNRILINKEKEGNLNGQINTLQEIVKAYMLNKQYQKALDFNLRIQQLLEDNQRDEKEQILAYNNLGYNYNYLNQYEESILYFSKALKQLDKKDFSAETILNTNIGIAYYNLGQFDASISYLMQARKIKSAYDPTSLDEIDQLLATVYLKKKDLHNAISHVNQAEARAKKNHNDVLLSDVYYTTALIQAELYQYDIALDFFQKHLNLRDSFELEERFRQQHLLQQQIDLERTEKQVKLLIINEDIKELTIAQLQVEAKNQRLQLQNKEAELLTEQKEKELLVKDNVIKASKLKTQELETQQANQKLELTRQQLNLQNKESQLANEQKEKDLLIRDREISSLELQKQRERVHFFYGLGALLILIIFVIVVGLIYSRKLNQKLNRTNIAIEKQKEEINEERKKSDGLLLNILPEQVATELKNTGKATTKKYENVTILFTDFKDFTALVATIPASLLVKELNDIFSRFDEIMEELQIEKIETIGDAYMAACGLPEENSDHALKCLNAAHNMLAFLKHRNKRSKIQWNMRVGIHSGPVVAGVVGKKKFAYDLFGDTVNTASRIESNGEAGKVNISETTYELIKNDTTFTFENRGSINAKGKGELEMWFVNQKALS